jgi:hypothetical protein
MPPYLAGKGAASSRRRCAQTQDIKGVAATRPLRNTFQQPAAPCADLPASFVTSHDGLESPDDIRWSQVIQKPFKPEDMAWKLEALFAARAAAAQAAT